MEVSVEYLDIPSDTRVCFDTMGTLLTKGFTSPVVVKRSPKGGLVVLKGKRVVYCARSISRVLRRPIKVPVELAL